MYVCTWSAIRRYGDTYSGLYRMQPPIKNRTVHLYIVHTKQTDRPTVSECTGMETGVHHVHVCTRKTCLASVDGVLGFGKIPWKIWTCPKVRGRSTTSGPFLKRPRVYDGCMCRRISWFLSILRRGCCKESRCWTCLVTQWQGCRETFVVLGTVWKRTHRSSTF